MQFFCWKASTDVAEAAIKIPPTIGTVQKWAIKGKLLTCAKL